MDPSKLLCPSSDGKVEWNTTRCILYTAEYATVILASDWLYFSRHAIKYNTIRYDTQHNTIHNNTIHCIVLHLT